MNEYDQFARLYDLEHRDIRDDIPLYHNLAMRCDGPVLELGCGSGRVCLSLAEAGFQVTGVDSSKEMLALASRRAEARGLLDRVRLEQIDARHMTFSAQFALVLFPLNGFMHLLTVDDQQAALHNACRALMPGGILVIDLSNPHVIVNPQSDGQLLLRRRFHGAQGSAAVSYAITQTDLAEQRQYVTLLYEEVDGQGLVRRTTVDTVLRFVYRFEMVHLLERAGFALDAVYGSYDLDPYEVDGDLMLCIAYRPEGDSADPL
jgi:SAM-dependent methyltransferase